MAKRKIEAKKFRRDVRAGLTVAELAKKYELSESRVNKYIERFIAEGKLEPDYSDRNKKSKQDQKAADAGDHAPYEPTIELATVCDKCGTLKLADSDQCPRCDLGKTKEIADDGTIEFDLEGDTEHLAKEWEKDFKLGDIADQVSVTHDIQVDPDLAQGTSGKKLFRPIHLIPVFVVLILLGVAGAVFMGVLPKPGFLKDDEDRAIAQNSKPVPTKREPRKAQNKERQNRANQRPARTIQRETEQVAERKKDQKIAQEDQTRVVEPKRANKPKASEEKKGLKEAQENKVADIPLNVKARIQGGMSTGVLRIAMIDAEAIDPVEIPKQNEPATVVKDEELDQPQDYSAQVGQGAKEEATVSSLKEYSEKGSEFLVAVTDGDIERVKHMLAQGAEADSRDKNGNTALMLAAGLGDLQMARLLLEHGANVHTKNYDGLTALGWAYSPMGEVYVPLRERRAVVRLLKEHTRRANGGLAVSPIIAPR